MLKIRILSQVGRGNPVNAINSLCPRQCPAGAHLLY